MESWFDVVAITEADWSQLRAIRLEMLVDAPIAFIERLDTAEAQTAAQWRERAARSQAPHHCGFAAVERSTGRWIGSMRAARVDDGRTSLIGVYVTPAFRGRQCGVTDALLDRVEAWARADGVDRFYLQVHGENPRARAFYRRRGYVETGVVAPHPLDPAHSEIEMVRTLS